MVYSSHMFALELILNIVIDRYTRKPRHLLSVGLLVLCVLSLSEPVFAASNDELMRIIERLEQRIEQLESQSSEVVELISESPDVISATPDSSFTKPPQTAPNRVVQKISMTPPPVPPLELIPPKPSPVTQANGVWTLFLNIESAQPEENVQPFTWEDIRKTFQVTDNAGVARMLRVDVSMEGEGSRTKTGRSLLLRTNYDYDFRYVVTYQLFLDGARILSAQKYLSSGTLEVDHRGRIPPKIFYDVENQYLDQIEQAPVQARFGCQNETLTTLTNQRDVDAVFRQLNTYACLVLDFEG